MMRQSRVRYVLRAGEKALAKDQDLRKVGCRVIPLTLDRGQSKAWNWGLRNFLSRTAPQAEARTKEVRDQAGASLEGLRIRQGDQKGAGGPATKGGLSGPSSHNSLVSSAVLWPKSRSHLPSLRPAMTHGWR